MKKMLAVLLPVLILCGVLCGCGNQSVSHSERLSVVTTDFQLYDWVRNILGEKAADTDLTLIPDPGADPHNYQPAEDDMVRISQCDLLLYVGGESDPWVEDALRKAGNPEMMAIRLLDILEDPVREDELTEGTEAGEYEYALKEHAEVLIPYLRDALIEADPTNAAVYTENSAACLAAE